jgi:hypothetical protein
MNLFSPMARNSIVDELEQISRILDAGPRPRAHSAGGFITHEE